jgi:hypothetical protein
VRRLREVIPDQTTGPGDPHDGIRARLSQRSVW